MRVRYVNFRHSSIYHIIMNEKVAAEYFVAYESCYTHVPPIVVTRILIYIYIYIKSTGVIFFSFDPASRATGEYINVYIYIFIIFTRGRKMYTINPSRRTSLGVAAALDK